MSGKDTEPQKPALPHRSNLPSPIKLGAAIRLPDGSYKPLGSGGTLTDDVVIAMLRLRTDKSELPVVHSGQEYPGGIMIFGQADYTTEELHDIFDRIRTFGYKVADMRPEWSEFADITPTVTASRTLKRANEYKVPAHIVNKFSHVEYMEALNFVRSIWREMDAIWQDDLGESVPVMPTISPNINSTESNSTEDQVSNALRIARAWCSARVARPQKSRHRSSPKRARDEEFLKLKDQGMESIDIQKLWNSKNADTVDVTIIDTAVCRLRRNLDKSESKSE